MVAKFVVFVAFVALAHGMVRREAPAQSPLQEVEKHAAEFQKTITEQWNALVNSKNTQAVNKALKEGSDSVLQQLSQLSTSLQGAINEANGKAKEALKTSRPNIEKAAAELRKAVDQRAGQLRDSLQAVVQSGVLESQKLAQEVAAHVNATTVTPAPQVKQAYDDCVKICRKSADKMSDRKAVIEKADMTLEMQQEAVDCATRALDNFNNEKDIAVFIKTEFDKKHSPSWHCIVGRSFGAYVSYETHQYIYFNLGQFTILLFKSGD